MTTSTEAKAKLMQCPKCGCEQPPSNECRRCRVIISKYNTIQKRQMDKKADALDLNKGYDHKKTAIVYWIFSLIFLVVGIGTLILIKRQINRNYVPTEARVVDSRMVDKTEGDTVHGYLYLLYEYKADQSVYTYRASYHLVKKWTPEYAEFQEIAESHPKNSVYPIHYNPRDPTKPIFDGVPANAWVPQAGMGILFVCLGIGLFLLGFKMHKKPVWVYWARANKIRDGAYEVFAADASGENMGWKIGFGILWNFFVILAVAVVVVERPNLSWQVILFFLFFISGGLFLLLKLVIGNYLAGRGFKQPKLIISKMPLKRGDVFKIKYNQIVNRMLWLKAVAISLQCYEDSEVGRGKKAIPTRKTLHSDKKKINLRREFASGGKIDLKQEFMIPTDAPLSTDYAVRYQVRWVLEIQILARKSFDFHAEFPIEVAN
jgi:hypothetical protein